MILQDLEGWWIKPIQVRQPRMLRGELRTLIESRKDVTSPLTCNHCFNTEHPGPQYLSPGNATYRIAPERLKDPHPVYYWRSNWEFGHWFNYKIPFCQFGKNGMSVLISGDPRCNSTENWDWWKIDPPRSKCATSITIPPLGDACDDLDRDGLCDYCQCKSVCVRGCDHTCVTSMCLFCLC